MLIKVKRNLKKVVVFRDGIKREYNLELAYNVTPAGKTILLDVIATKEANALLNATKNAPIGEFFCDSKEAADKEFTEIARKIFNKTINEVVAYLADFNDEERNVIMNKAFTMLSRGEVK